MTLCSGVIPDICWGCWRSNPGLSHTRQMHYHLCVWSKATTAIVVLSMCSLTWNENSLPKSETHPMLIFLSNKFLRTFVAGWRPAEMDGRPFLSTMLLVLSFLQGALIWDENDSFGSMRNPLPVFLSVSFTAPFLNIFILAFWIYLIINLVLWNVFSH